MSKQEAGENHHGLAPWCEECPLRRLDLFEDFSPSELGFMQGFKIAHRVAQAGATLMKEGSADGHLYTLFTGWAFRYKLLPDGRRQILNVLLPGDTIGLDAVIGDPPYYSVQAATDISYCVLDAIRKLPVLFRDHPSLALKLTRIALRERQGIDRRLTLTGRCAAEERIASFMLDAYDRLAARGLVRDHSFLLPMTQNQLADALGLNIIHLNRMLRRLRECGLLLIQDREARLLDLEQLRRLAPIHGGLTHRRPLL
jgi:CRP-like cAMP-binding protein